MKKANYKEKLVIIVLFIYILLYSVLVKNFSSSITYFNILFWISIAIVSFFGIGYIKCRKIVKKDSIQLIFIYVIIYFIFTYLLGLITGFANTPFSLKFIIMLKNIIPFIIYIIAKELTRYILLSKVNNNKKWIWLITIVYMLIDIITTSTLYDFASFNDIFRFIGVTLLGSGFKNILLTYISLNAGEIPCIIYCLMMEGYIYIVPFVPNLGEYLETIFLIVLPVLLTLHLNKMYVNNKETNKKRNKIKKIYYQIPIVLALIVIVALVSGVFKYKLYTIASNSMKPLFSRGDAVVIEKYTGDMEIKQDDVIAFAHDNLIYIHRVVKIRKYNNSLYYTTKGDNNSTNDNFEVSDKDVVGIARFYIPLIGYPTVWLSEIIS